MISAIRSRFADNSVKPAKVIRDISWCFRPLFIWMRILGIDLYPTSEKSIRFYGFVMLLVGTWVHIENNFDTFRKLFAFQYSTSTTINWNIGIDYGNNLFFIILVSLVFYYVARNQWQLLWGLILKFDSSGYRLNHKWIRKMLFIGFLVVLLEICTTLFIFSAILPDFPRESTYRKCVIAFDFFAKILPLSALVLYCSVAWLSSLFYEEIRKDIERTYKVNRENIRRWKCSLALAREVVDHINDTFGLILLISITHFFVDFICHSFYSVKNLPKMNRLHGTVYVANVLRKLILLWFIVFAPTKIRQNASTVATSLRKISCARLGLQNQVYFLALDTFQNPPQVSSLGYFDVNLQLIPKLIGTILTYLVILYQFQSSEKNV